jgi:RNA polymerase sigma factor (TIGR02999 family)
MSLQAEVTTLLGQIRAGEPDAPNRLVRLIQPELKQIARGLMHRERLDHTLQATALVNEGFLRLFRDDFLALAQDRAHFFAAMATAMREVLVDHARARAAHKRGGGWQRQPLDDLLDEVEQSAGDLEDLHEALEQLAALAPRQAQIIELRFFGGHSMAEVAELLGLSLSAVEKDYARARNFLLSRLEDS